MATSRQVRVHCDFPHCLRTWGTATTVKSARLGAYNIGWRYREGKDTCPTHSIFQPHEWASHAQ